MLMPMRSAELDDESVDPREVDILAAVICVDQRLARARAQSLDGGRSKARGGGEQADLDYGNMLVEAGFPPQFVRFEIGESKTSRLEGKGYVSRTFRKVIEQAMVSDSAVVEATCSHRSLSGDTLYTLEKDLLNRSSTFVGDQNEVSPQSPSDKPRLFMVTARPGDGKTTGAVDYLAMSYGPAYSRMAVSGQFVAELVQHQYVINSCFPEGRTAPLHLPSTTAELREALPKDVLDLKRNGEQVWTDERLAQLKYPGAFYLNILHPKDTDGRLKVLADKYSDPETRQEWSSFVDWNDPAEWQPHAVVRFSPTVDLCTAGWRSSTLREGHVCGECQFLACGANTSTKGGAKTLWGRAPVAVLAHRSLEVQTRLSPERDDFGCIVLDELPSFVFRYPAITIRPMAPHAEATPWKLDVLDDLEERFHKLDLDEDALAAVNGVFDRSRRGAREELEHRARKLRRDAVQGDRVPTEQRVDHRLKPLMSREDFDLLVRHSRARDEERAEPDGRGDNPFALLDMLLRLADFVGETPFRGFLEHTFDKRGDGYLKVYRPINGWKDLLLDGRHRPRDIVVLDATAGLDPRYRLVDPQVAEKLPAFDFPGTTLVLTSANSVTKAAAREKDASAVLGHVVAAVRDRLAALAARRTNGLGVVYEPKLLIVTSSEAAPELERLVPSFQADGRLPTTTTVDYFGNLRGKNQYRDYDAVFFTHIHRLPDEHYLSLAMLLQDFGPAFDKQWHHKSLTEKSSWNPRLVRYRAMTCDLYQDILRIGIRSDPSREVLVFIPSSEAPLVARLMRLLRGARVEQEDGAVIWSRPDTPQATARADGGREAVEVSDEEAFTDEACARITSKNTAWHPAMRVDEAVRTRVQSVGSRLEKPWDLLRAEAVAEEVHRNHRLETAPTDGVVGEHVAGEFFEATVANVRSVLVEMLVRVAAPRRRWSAEKTALNIAGLVEEETIRRSVDEAQRGDRRGWVAVLAAELVIAEERRKPRSSLSQFYDHHLRLR